MEARFYTASEVAEMLGVSRTKAYKVIQALNNDLKAGGYIVVAGKVPIAYFNEKCYGGATVQKEGM